MKCLEAQHVFGNSLDKPVILLKDIVEIFNLQDFNHLAVTGHFPDCVYSLCSGQAGSAFINDNFVWNTVGCDGFLEETSCRTEISAFGEHEIKRLSVTINGPVQIRPLSSMGQSLLQNGLFQRGNVTVTAITAWDILDRVQPASE